MILWVLKLNRIDIFFQLPMNEKKILFNFRDAIHIENTLCSFKWDIEFPSAANFSVKIR